VNGRADVLEYSDYYAMGGVARSGGTMRYRYGYQGQYSERDKETEWNSFDLRQYDPVVGRWLSPDPYGQFNSPYVGMGNDWAMQVDTDGGWSWAGAAIGAGVGFATGSLYGLATDKDNWWKYGLAGAAGGFVGGGLSATTTTSNSNRAAHLSSNQGANYMALANTTTTTWSFGSMASAAAGLARGLIDSKSGLLHCKGINWT